MSDESSPLLQFPGMGGGNFDGLGDHHTQFCHLIGIRPLTHPPGQPWKPQETSLYYRATRHRRNQGATYVLTATLTNTLLLAQIVLGAALTGLGASDSSRVLITVFGALNTVIAGLIAFLRSRGQPVRARMFRDELDRIVNEIENSAVMWHGVSKNVHGYSDIDTNDSVTNSTINDPDNFAAGMSGDPYSAALRTRPGQPGQPALPPAVQAPATVVPTAPADVAAPVPAAAVPDPDESPATKAPEPPKAEEPKPQDAAKAKEDDKQSSVSTPAEDASKSIESGASQPEASSSATKTATDQSSVAQQPKSATDREDESSAGVQSQKHSEDTSH
ncbi:hypothetical protein LTR56_023960 [Elasticomyces elasticus]|nr:hypothetical protein LTR56_023960 [Elasticomyces elasticus]KAK5758198.1 hypothetical protein LTS12_011668 [Elasticomyces elasticus]